MLKVRHDCYATALLWSASLDPGHVSRYHIDQFSILDLNKTRILGYYCQGSTFFDREILDGIGPKPGGVYIHCGYSHPGFGPIPSNISCCSVGASAPEHVGSSE